MNLRPLSSIGTPSLEALLDELTVEVLSGDSSPLESAARAAHRAFDVHPLLQLASEVNGLPAPTPEGPHPALRAQLLNQIQGLPQQRPLPWRRRLPHPEERLRFMRMALACSTAITGLSLAQALGLG